MKVAIVGGTGFVGSYLVDAIIEAGHHPVVMVRSGSESKLRQPNLCTTVTGELGNIAAIEQLVKDADAVIYNVGILREFPSRGITFEGLQYAAAKRVIDAAAAANVKKFLLMSANGVSAKGTAYQESKYAAEQHLMTTDMNWSIFRPSVIYGDPRGRMEFASQLHDEVIRLPLPAPLFFDGIDPRKAGKFKLSPVHVEDVARAFVHQLVSEEQSRRIFHLGGPDNMTWQSILQTIAQAVDVKKLMLPVPVLGVRLAASVLDRYEEFPVTRDQLTMLLQGNTCSADDLMSMGIKPRRFVAPELGYLHKQSAMPGNAMSNQNGV